MKISLSNIKKFVNQCMGKLSKTYASYFQSVVLSAKPVEKTHKEIRVYKQTY